jgi:hypothetical protein
MEVWIVLNYNLLCQIRQDLELPYLIKNNLVNILFLLKLLRKCDDFVNL